MIVFGTMPFGGQVDAREAARLIDLAWDGGITRFDTANVYNDGRSERILGRCLRGRQTALVSTKVGGRYASRKEGLSRKHILKACDGSLKRLGVERIDVYYMHQPDPETPVEETLAAMESLLDAGKINRVGASNFAAWQVVEMTRTVSVVQPMYNLLARGIEREFLPMCREFDLDVLVYNPLAGGLLTGKHRPGKPARGTRFCNNEMYLKRYWHDAMFRAVADFARVARDTGKTPVQLALQWLRAQKVGIVLGATRTAQLKECMAALNGRLDDAALKACDRVYDRLHGPIPGYNR